MVMGQRHPLGTDLGRPLGPRSELHRLPALPHPPIKRAIPPSWKPWTEDGLADAQGCLAALDSYMKTCQVQICTIKHGRGEGGRVAQTAYSLAMGGALLLHWQQGTTLVAAGSLKDS